MKQLTPCQCHNKLKCPVCYELNKKQKKGETIDTCVNAVIDREFNPPMRFALESMGSVINVERARYMSCCQAPSYHFTI